IRFRSMAGLVDFETERAGSLAEPYRTRLSERRTALETLARQVGWKMTVHHTDTSPRVPLLWAYSMLRGGV
ncbi:MAG: DUF58 domain-containing protein, partial [Rubricella sp.]